MAGVEAREWGHILDCVIRNASAVLSSISSQCVASVTRSTKPDRCRPSVSTLTAVAEPDQNAKTTSPASFN